MRQEEGEKVAKSNEMRFGHGRIPWIWYRDELEIDIIWTPRREENFHVGEKSSRYGRLVQISWIEDKSNG